MTRSTRSKSSPKKSPTEKKKILASENTFVFLVKDADIKHNEDSEQHKEPSIVSLRHPGKNAGALFLLSSAKGVINEVLSFSEPLRSWFINDTVKSDGTLHLSTPIDPLFLILQYLRDQCSQQAIPLDQVLKDSDFPETDRLITICSSKQLSSIADQKGSEDLQAFKFNEDKTLSWLKVKILRIVDVLKKKNIHVGQGAVSATFVRSSKAEPADEDSYLRYAHGIISEYISDDLSKKLFSFLNIKEELNHKRKSSASNELPKSKKIKSELDISDSDLNILKPEKPKTISAKEKARAKAASGTKSISSFFMKK